MDGFKVLTEFRFDIGSALVNSKKLQDGVDGVARAADQANLTFEALRASVVGAFSPGQFGLIATLKSAIGVADDFNASALDFSQLMAQNMGYLQGDIHSFNDRLSTSKDLLDQIGAGASKLGLSPTSAIVATKQVAGAMIPQGTAGSNLGNAQTLALGGLQVAKALGISGKDIGKEISGILSTKQDSPVQGTLFSSLVNGTKSFGGFKGDDSGFTALGAADRMKLLNKGLKELRDNLGTTGKELVTFSDFTDHLKDVLYGIGGVLKPIGDAILPVLTKAIAEFSDRFSVVGKQVGQQVGSFLKQMLDDPRKLMEQLGALRGIGRDFSLAKEITKIFFVIETGLKVLKFLGIGSGTTMGGLFMRGLTAALSGMGRLFVGLFSMEGLAAAFSVVAFAAKAFMWTLRGMAFVLGEILLPIAIMTSVFQGIRRAWEAAKIDHAVDLFNMMPKITNLMGRAAMAVENFLHPFYMIGEGFALMLKPIFDWILNIDFLIDIGELFVEILEYLGDGMVLAMATVNGFVAAIFQMVENLKSGSWMDLTKGVKKAFNDGIDDYIGKNLKQVDEGKNVSNLTTIIGKVEIKNDFKENQEPDRIAFTMKEQLLKAAQNPKQARGQALQSGFATR